MNNFALLDFWTDLTNIMFRNISDVTRYILIFVFVTLGTFFLAKSLNKKDKNPIKFSYLFLAALCYTFLFLYIFIR